MTYVQMIARACIVFVALFAQSKIGEAQSTNNRFPRRGSYSATTSKMIKLFTQR